MAAAARKLPRGFSILAEERTPTPNCAGAKVSPGPQPIYWALTCGAHTLILILMISACTVAAPAVGDAQELPEGLGGRGAAGRLKSEEPV